MPYRMLTDWAKSNHVLSGMDQSARLRSLYQEQDLNEQNKKINDQTIVQNEQIRQQNDLKLEKQRFDLEKEKTELGYVNKVSEIYGQEKDLGKAEKRILAEIGPRGLLYLQPVIDLEKSLNELDDASAKKALEQSNIIQSSITEIFTLPPEQRTAALQNRMRFLAENGVISPETAAKYQIWDDDLMSGVYDHTANTIKTLTQRQLEAAAQKAEADARYAQLRAEGREPIQPKDKIPTDETDLAYMASDTRLTEEERKIAANALAMLQKYKTAIRPQSNVNYLTQEGLDLAANQYAMTGQMPPMGMASTQARSAIINRAAELYPAGTIAENKAAFDANKASLTQLQKSYDAIVSFERTAQKNLNVLLDSAKNITDTGSPWINTPIRLVQEKLLGNADIPAFRAARRIDVNEIAKIVSNPNMTGVLTNEARNEIDSLVPDNVTIGQLIRVGQLMRRDMNNRKTSIEEQIADIQKRIGGIRTNRPGNQNSDPGVKPTIGDIKTFPNGKRGRWDGIGWEEI